MSYKVYTLTFCSVFLLIKVFKIQMILWFFGEITPKSTRMIQSEPRDQTGAPKIALYSISYLNQDAY